MAFGEIAERDLDLESEAADLVLDALAMAGYTVIHNRPEPLDSTQALD